MPAWTKEDIKTLEEKYPKNGVKIPELLEKFSRSAIVSKAYVLKKKYIGREKYKITREELTDLYLNKKWSSNRIAKHYGCSEWVIRDRFERYGIRFRKRAESIDLNPKNLKHIKINDYTQQIIDGVMLSDGHLTSRKDQKKTSSLIINQEMNCRQFLDSIKSVFEKNDIKCSNIYNDNHTNYGKKFPSCRLATLSYAELKKERDRWYTKNHKKIVPKDIKLTPLTIAYWYMGDGSLMYNTPNKRKKKFYYIQLCTECFNKDDQDFLVGKLNKTLGLHFILQRFRNTYRIFNKKQNEVKDFLFKMYPYMIDCFSYKWRALNNPDFGLERVKWTDRHKEILNKYYGKFGSNIPELIKQGHEITHIYQMAQRLGLKCDYVKNQYGKTKRKQVYK